MIQDHNEHSDLFVLKTFDAANANQHRKELHTYVDLMEDASNKNITSIVRFYGSYMQAEKFNIVLEYANEGSLETFLQHNTPPTQVEHIRDFWKNLLELLKALVYLHNHSEGGMCVVFPGICTDQADKF